LPVVATGRGFVSFKDAKITQHIALDRRSFLHKTLLLSAGAAAGFFISRAKAAPRLEPTGAAMPRRAAAGEPLVQTASPRLGLI